MSDPLNQSIDTFDQLPSQVLNEENKKLSKKVKQQQVLLKDKEKEREQLQDRIDLLDKHLKSVKSEISHTQSLVNAKEKEMETENHLRQLAEREIGRLSNDLQQYENEFTNVQDQLDRVQNEIFHANEKLEKFKHQMNFNQEELEQWALAEKQKEEDMLQIEKIQRKDEAKIKELTMIVEKLTTRRREKKQQYEQEITETQAAQIELDKTAQDFKKLHKERQDLVTQWEDSIESMKKRDDLIQRDGERFANGKKLIRQKQEELYHESQHLELHAQNNRQLSQKIDKLNRNVEKSRSELESLKAQTVELNDEIDVLKNTLSKASNEFNSQRIENKQLEEQLVQKQKKLESLKAQEAKEKSNLENSQNKLESLEAQTHRVEDMLKNTQQKLKNLDKALQDLKDEQYKQSEELFKVRQLQANLVAEIGGTNAQNKNMQAKILQMDNDAYKQQELLYNIGFQIQHMERKVHRAQGNRTEEEKEKLEAQERTLKDDLQSIEQQYAILSNELKKVAGEVRKLRTKCTRRELERGTLEDQVNELTLENDSHEKELKQLTREREDILVNHDVLKLQVKRRRDLLSRRSDEICGLENRKYQLELTLSQKESQIEAQKAVLVAELKAAEEERRNIALELADRRVQIDKLKNKFEILTNRLNPNPDEEVSQVKFLIQAIQEREELQRKGDMLDAEIQKLEREEQAMEKTLGLFKQHNSLHLSNFRRVDKKDESYKQMRQYELKIKEMDKLISRRMNERKDYADSCDIKARELQYSQQQKEQIHNDLQVLNRLKENAEKEIEDVQSHLSRRRALIRKDRSKLDESGEISNQLKDLEIYLMKQTNTQMLQTLQNFVAEDRGMQATLNRLLTESDVQMPSRPTSGVVGNQ